MLSSSPARVYSQRAWLSAELQLVTRVVAPYGGWGTAVRHVSLSGLLSRRSRFCWCRLERMVSVSIRSVVRSTEDGAPQEDVFRCLVFLAAGAGCVGTGFNVGFM